MGAFDVSTITLSVLFFLYLPRVCSGTKKTKCCLFIVDVTSFISLVCTLLIF